MQPEWARSPAPTPRQFSRRELFIWLASILCASAFAQSMTHGGTTALSLESIGAFQILGWFAVLRLLYLQTSSAPASSRDFWVAGVVVAIDLLPSGKATWIAATLAALYIYAGNEKGSNGRAGAAVLGALSVQSLWGPTLFSLFTVYILRADAALVGVALKLTRGGFDWHENVISTQGFTVGIYNDCSSFHNISLAALCWISLTKLHRPTFIKSDFKFRRGGLSRDDRAQRGAPLHDFARSRELRLLARWRRSADIRRDRVVRHRGDLRVGGFNRRREA